MQFNKNTPNNCEANMECSVNGLYVEIKGNSNSIPIVFIHGFPFDSWMWHKQTTALAKHYKCVTYDIRGLGKSYVGDGQYTMEAYVDDLYSVIDDLNLNKPVICGLSMGGYIALRALEKDEKKFSAAIFMDTKPQADNNAAKLNRAAGINKINTEGLSKFAEEFVPNTFAEESKAEMKELYSETLSRTKTHNPTGVKGALLAMLSRTSTEDYLPEISIPVLTIVGALDKLTPPQVIREMCEKIPDSEFAIAPRSGHLPALENSSFVNDVIKGFLERKL